MVGGKREDEIAAMRRAGAVVGDVLHALRAMAAPGVRLSELERFAAATIRQRGGVPTFLGYHGFPSALCLSVNEQVVHGLATRRKLANGDLLSIDLGVTLDGWVGDAAITVPIGVVADRHRALIAAAETALRAALAVAAVGARLGDLGAAIEGAVRGAGFDIVRSYCGHGVGRSLHEDPQVPNVGQVGTGPMIEDGWCLAIEPLITEGDADVVVLDDGWTVATADRRYAAHAEHSVAVRASGVEILTLTSDGRWP